MTERKAAPKTRRYSKSEIDAALEHLILAGAKMSKWMFNVAQHKDLPEDWRQSMIDMRIDWDTARSRYNGVRWLDGKGGKR